MTFQKPLIKLERNGGLNMESEIIYKTDIYNAVYNVLMAHLANEEVPSGVIHDVLKTINEAPSTFWHPCTDEENIPPKGEEVLVSIEMPNGHKEVAFGENWGENMNGDVAYWGGQNGIVRAWARVPDFYEGE